MMMVLREVMAWRWVFLGGICIQDTEIATLYNTT